MLNLGKKCHFWLFLSPETQFYTILATFNGQTLCKLIIKGTYLKKLCTSQIRGPNCEISAIFGHFCYFWGSNQIFLPIFFAVFSFKKNRQVHLHPRGSYTSLIQNAIFQCLKQPKMAPKHLNLVPKPPNWRGKCHFSSYLY